MNAISLKVLTLVIGLTIISCKDKNWVKDQPRIKDSVDLLNDAIFKQAVDIADDSVKLNLQINQIDQNHFDLEIGIKLYGGTWIVSPLETGFPYSETIIEFETQDHVAILDAIIEQPISQVEYDPTLEKSYRRIKSETTLKQNIKIISDIPFEVKGRLFFILEPICTPNEMYFKLVHNEGHLGVEWMD